MMQQVAALPTEVAAPAKSVASQSTAAQDPQAFSSVFEQHQQTMRENKPNPSENRTSSSSSDSAKTNASSKPQHPSDENRSADETVKATDKKSEKSQASENDPAANKDDYDNTESSEKLATKQNNAEKEQTAESDTESKVDTEKDNAQQNDDTDVTEDDSLVLTEAQIKQNWMTLLERLTANQANDHSVQHADSEKGEDTGNDVSDLLQMLYDKLDVKDGDVEDIEGGAETIEISGQMLARLQVLMEKLTQVVQTEANSENEVSEEVSPEQSAVENENTRSQLADLIALLNQYKQDSAEAAEQIAQSDHISDVDNVKQDSAATILDADASDELLASVNPILEWLASLGSDAEVTEQVKQDAQQLTKELSAFLAMPKEKMNKLLTQLTQQTMPQASDETKQAFIQSLQSAVDDMNKQLDNGRVPAIDLQAMLGKVVNDLSKTDSTVSNDPARQGLKQLMELAKLTSANQDPSAVQAVVMDKPTDQHEGFSTDAHKLLNAHQTQVDKTSTNLQKMEGLKQLVDKVQVMVNQRNMVADIRIDPPDMGTMQIRLHIANEQASVSFVVQNQHARDALEQSTPRLREMLSERGIELGQSSVRQENQQGKGAEQQGQGTGNGQFAQLDSTDNLDEPEITQTLNVVNGAVNGIDYFV